MKTFKGIIYKDFVTVGAFSYICYYLCLLITAFSAFTGKMPFYSYFLFFFIYMEQPCGALWADDTQGWTKYSQTLMLPRTSIINCKYIHMILNWLAGIIIVELCLIVGNSVRGEPLIDLENIIVMSVSVLILCVISLAGSLMLFGHKFLSVGFIGISGGFIGGYYGGSMGENGSFSMQSFTEVDEDVKFMFESNFHLKVMILCAVITAAVWVFTLVRCKRKDF